MKMSPTRLIHCLRGRTRSRSRMPMAYIIRDVWAFSSRVLVDNKLGPDFMPMIYDIFRL